VIIYCVEVKEVVIPHVMRGSRDIEGLFVRLAVYRETCSWRDNEEHAGAIILALDPIVNT